MSERGVFAVDRGIWDHPMFASREPFSRREAWLWLVSSAVWKRRALMVDRKRVNLERGQLAFSVRFMADQWGWSKSAVHRFLDALKTETMIETEVGQSITVITICKYEEYQKVSLPDRDTRRDETGTVAGQSRDKEESREYKEEDIDAASRASASLISPEAFELADELTVIAGHDLKFVPPGWCGAAMRVQVWLSEWPREIIIAAVTAAANRKRGPPANRPEYFEPAIAEEFARQSAPLPKVEIRETPTVVAYGKPQNRSGGSLLDALDRRIAEAELAEKSDPALPAGPILRISH